MASYLYYIKLLKVNTKKPLRKNLINGIVLTLFKDIYVSLTYPKEVCNMAKYCEICKKGVMSGNKVSHSNRHTRTYWAPNVQKVSAIIDGQKRRVTVCTRCLRSGKVQRTI